MEMEAKMKMYSQLLSKNVLLLCFVTRCNVMSSSYSTAWNWI